MKEAIVREMMNFDCLFMNIVNCYTYLKPIASKENKQQQKGRPWKIIDEKRSDRKKSNKIEREIENVIKHVS